MTERAPEPGPFEFTAAQERAMRQSANAGAGDKGTDVKIDGSWMQASDRNGQTLKQRMGGGD